MSHTELPAAISPTSPLLHPDHEHHHADDLYGKLWGLANNLWWSWHPECDQLFRDIDPIRWRQLDHNPVALLREMTPERLAERASELVLHSRINYAYRRLQEYLAESQTWASTNAGVLGAKPVAYFSAEFGIHESVPIYSGGLGVLAGDHIKSASGLGVPLIGVGLYYAQGYFRQYLDDDGYQGEDYLETTIDNLPMRPALDKHEKPITVSIETRNGELLAKVWLMHVGRVRLYLLDCNVEGNKPEDRELTSRLYGGDQRTRIRQELVLGIGGVKALAALGIDPGVYHLNEGHSAFGPLQVVKQLMEDDGVSFEQAVRQASRMTCFTTHTPVPAGHDRFPPDLVEEHLGPLRDSLGISEQELLSLGRVDAHNAEETFCMTVIGFKMSRYANAVSNLHGVVSRRMWAHMWPDRAEDEVPIGHITNGVHVPSWLAGQMALLYDKHFPADWKHRIQEPQVWQCDSRSRSGRIVGNPQRAEEQSAVVCPSSCQPAMPPPRRKRRSRRSSTTRAGPARPDDWIRTQVCHLQARQLAVQSDRSHVAELLRNEERPVQLIYAGKAHPKDEPGKRFIQEISNLRHDPRFKGRVAFHGRLRHQRLSSPDPGRRCLAEQSPPTARGQRDQRPKSRAQRRSELQHSGRLVGRSLQRGQWFRDRPRSVARSDDAITDRRDAEGTL